MAQIRELEPILCHPGLTSQLIWTSSGNARRSAFDVEDIQHRRGTQPYSSSKYASDLLSLALNTRYNKHICSRKHYMITLLFLLFVCFFSFTMLMPVILLLSLLLGTLLVRHLSRFCVDWFDLRHLTLLPGLHLDSAHAALLAGEGKCGREQRGQ